MGNTAGENPFIVIARVQVKEGMVEEYLEASDACDKAAEASTPGMLMHKFCADPDDPLLFAWSEVFENSEAWLMHASSAYAGDYIEKHFQLADGLSIEIYGDVSQEVADTCNGMGLPVKHFTNTRVGYARI